MCGICFILDEGEQLELLQKCVLCSSLCNRGPDVQNSQVVSITEQKQALFCGFTLHFRGKLTPQPLIDEAGNVLLWNGEIFGGIEVSDGSNDGDVLLSLLDECSDDESLLTVFSKVQGPWAFVYLQKESQKVWFGRDYFGRRSLLLTADERRLYLSSIAILDKEWIEVPANGIYCLQLSDGDLGRDADLVDDKCSHQDKPDDSATFFEQLKENLQTHWNGNSCLTVFPWLPKDTEGPERLRNILTCDTESLVNPELGTLTNVYGTYGVYSGIMSLNRTLPVGCLDGPGSKPENMEQLCSGNEESADSVASQDAIGPDKLMSCVNSEQKEAAAKLLDVLGESVEVRVKAQSDLCAECLKSQLPSIPEQIKNGQPVFQASKVKSADHQIGCGHARTAVLFSGGIDSLVLAALADRYVDPREPIDLLNVAFEQTVKPAQPSKKKATNKKETSSNEPSYMVPDRVTGLQGLAVLNPNRKWNFVQINVTKEELQVLRDKKVQKLVYPLQTVLDDSIGCALWFAARGQGFIEAENGEMQPYNSTARVLLVGMGADEQLIGYSRHRVKFKSGGWAGLLGEIQMEINRISSRNLGRDDRIITDHGKEARFPYLDENFVSFLSSLPISTKADLRLPRGLGEKLLLRLAALELKLGECIFFPKRAIQFGSRIAKLENRKEKASDVCKRLQKPKGLDISHT